MVDGTRKRVNRSDTHQMRGFLARNSPLATVPFDLRCAPRFGRGSWSGLGPGNSPLIVRDISLQEIYALELSVPCVAGSARPLNRMFADYYL
jgi:hypothetical protein